MPVTEIQLDKKLKKTVREPKKWKVIFINDDVTTVDFVIAVLIDVFGHSVEQAQELTMEIHENGSSVVGIYNFEIAETKANETIIAARNSNFPLQVKIEEE